MWFCMSDQLFKAHFWLSIEVVYLQRWHGWRHMKLLPSRCVLCAPYNHEPCHFMWSHIHNVHAYLAVTCHLHFWQNHWGLLHATVVTRGLNGYWNRSQHRKLTMEKKTLQLLLQGFEPMTIWSQVQCSNHWAIPAPQHQISHNGYIMVNCSKRLFHTPAFVQSSFPWTMCCMLLLKVGGGEEAQV